MLCCDHIILNSVTVEHTERLLLCALFSLDLVAVSQHETFSLIHE
jgi:hypothetical protein